MSLHVTQLVADFLIQTKYRSNSILKDSSYTYFSMSTLIGSQTFFFPFSLISIVEETRIIKWICFNDNEFQVPKLFLDINEKIFYKMCLNANLISSLFKKYNSIENPKKNRYY